MSSSSQGLDPHEGLEWLLVKMGSTRLLVEPRPGPQAGKSRYLHSQDADIHHKFEIQEHNKNIENTGTPSSQQQKQLKNQ